MFSHCNHKFKPCETWFLFDNDGFQHRKLELYVCPNKNCNKEFVKLIETRISDGKLFCSVYVSQKSVSKIIQKCMPDVDYTDLDVRKPKQSPFGFRFGLNKEIHRNGKIIEIKQYSSDFNNNKELIKKLSL